MARKFALECRNVQNVVASGTALVVVPVGRRIHGFIIQHGYTGGTNTLAGAALNVSEINFKLDGRSQRRVTGKQLRDLLLLNGSGYDFVGLPNTAPGVAMFFPFSEPWRKDLNDIFGTSLPTVWQKASGGGGAFDSVQIEIKLGAATAPTLKVYMIVDDVIPTLKAGQNAPWFVKWLPYSFPAAGTKFDVSTIDRRDFLLQASFYPDTGAGEVPTVITIRKDSEILTELTYSANKAHLLASELDPANAGRSATIFDVVFDANDALAYAEDLNASRELVATVESANAMSGTMTALVQRIGPPE